MPSTREKLVFPLIDLLRGFAALAVLVYHLIAHWDWTDFPSTGPLAWLREGWMAVDLFFVISGFVIGLSAFSRMEAQGPGFRAAFLRSRLARIVPLHYLTLAVFVVLVEPSLRQQGDFLANLLAHLLFIHNLFPSHAGAINGPNWSLATEMHFYLLMAVAAPWLCKARGWKLAVALVAIAWAWRWGVHALFLPGSVDAAYFAQTQLPGMLDEFAVGLLLARFVRTPAGVGLLARLRSDPRIRWGLAAIAGLCWWALLAVLQAHDYWEEAAMAVFFRTALACCAGIVLLLLCGWPMPKGGAMVRIALYLGKISYGIYLWHLAVLILLARHTQLEPLAALPVAVLATLGLAALTWHLVEQPMLERWSRTRRPTADGSSPPRQPPPRSLPRRA
jgi:peptidoglycan/LPS O-acetylase OafA/YrhL